SRDSRVLLTGCADGMVRLWESATGRPVGKPLAHRGPVRAAAFLPDGTRLVTGSGDQLIRLWDINTAELLRQAPHPAPVLALALSPDGRKVLTGGADGTARLWESATLKPVGPTLPRAGGEVVTVGFSPHGRVLLALWQDECER